MFFITSKGTHRYDEPKYEDMDEVFLLFGKETKGLPEDIMKKYINKTMRIPMIDGIRCLNLSNAVSILAYEVIRHTNFANFKETSERLLED